MDSTPPQPAHIEGEITVTQPTSDSSGLPVEMRLTLAERDILELKSFAKKDGERQAVLQFIGTQITDVLKESGENKAAIKQVDDKVEKFEGNISKALFEINTAVSGVGEKVTNLSLQYVDTKATVDGAKHIVDQAKSMFWSKAANVGLWIFFAALALGFLSLLGFHFSFGSPAAAPAGSIAGPLTPSQVEERKRQIDQLKEGF